MTPELDEAPPLHPSADLHEPDERQSSPSVSKALQLLDSFRNGAPSQGVSELARRAALPKSTAFRLLSHLERGGYVERTGTNYRLGWRLFELGNRVQHCRPRGLRELALPHLSELYARTGHVVNLAVLEGTEVVYLDKIHGRHAVRTPTTVGSRMPAACVGLGKAMLAFSGRPAVQRVLTAGLERRTAYSIAEPGRLLQELERIRTSGTAFDHEEAALGLACVAAPILVGGRCLAAISISSATTRFNPAAIVPHVRRAAAGISADCPGPDRV
ncbi:transcriptional regulator, IclR family [Pseudonocardia ammonioxydans]|uniref:Glycerol operon regulatory protein n=1 Tax=Pseudonocardia ammonioxydans TaxID=260086 RepID=A0A1I5EJ35_PSUAM|nr:IclR family transcriptional regulator [Pseudonocardia ammonioxydans]SFO11346.1 transcriptional regulator, IclR family [Pseudonocardia ammonioxydans]